MKVFISWSGAFSGEVAKLLRDWLIYINNAIKPFLSSEDIQKGTFGISEIEKQLDGSSMGLCCLTKKNCTAEWINYEAGAIGKHAESSRIFTLLLDIGYSDIKGPLSKYQHTVPTHDDMFRLVTSINANLKESDMRAAENLRTVFEQWWPSFEEKFSEIKARYENAITEPIPVPNDELNSGKLNELVEMVRKMNSDLSEVKIKLENNQFTNVPINWQIPAKVYTQEEIRKMGGIYDLPELSSQKIRERYSIDSDGKFTIK
jgi:hypothetical protein